MKLFWQTHSLNSSDFALLCTNPHHGKDTKKLIFTRLLQYEFASRGKWHWENKRKRGWAQWSNSEAVQLPPPKKRIVLVHRKTMAIVIDEVCWWVPRFVQFPYWSFFFFKRGTPVAYAQVWLIYVKFIFLFKISMCRLYGALYSPEFTVNLHALHSLKLISVCRVIVYTALLFLSQWCNPFLCKFVSKFLPHMPCYCVSFCCAQPVCPHSL